jgi:hypothetical protein
VVQATGLGFVNDAHGNLGRPLRGQADPTRDTVPGQQRAVPAVRHLQ